MSKLAKALTAAAGNAGGESLYVEDVFSTYLYEGTAETNVIENGIALGDSGEGGSILLEAQADGLEIAQSTDFDFGTGDLTCEAWVWLNDTDEAYRSIFGFDISGGLLFQVYQMKLDFGVRLTSSLLSTATLSANTWNHLAIVRSSGTSYLFINGTLDSTSTTHSSRDFSNLSDALIGDYSKNITNFNGRISNLRVSNTARYTSTFTVPTSALSSDANTVLLIGQDDSPFTDNSSSSHIAVPYGNPEESTFGPFDAAEAGAGGLVWIKSRTSGDSGQGWHTLTDSERGSGQLYTNSTDAQYNAPAERTVYLNSNGFSVSSGDIYHTNNSGTDYASWTFRKAEKFFDVVTYTGNGTAQTVAHNLGSVPACILVKKTSGAESWAVYHQSLGKDYWLILNDTSAKIADFPGNYTWNNQNPTSTSLFFGGSGNVNQSGDTYVAYLFASDAGGFGDDGDESIIKCGSFTVDGSGYSPNVELGFEPQWILMRPATTTGAWVIVDTMRGWVNNGTAADDANLRPNAADAEAVNDIGWPYSTGFYAGYRGSPGAEWIYIAIRRPMKTPESGTEVFSPIASTSTPPTTSYTVGFPADLLLQGFRTYGLSARTNTRLTGSSAYLETAQTNSESSGFGGEWDLQDDYAQATGVSTGLISYMFKRATGFFDVVAYTGNGSASGQVINHNLGVTPEIIIIKGRSNSAREWHTYVSSQGQDKALFINSSGAEQANTVLVGGTINSTQYELKVDFGNVNGNGETYISYLFATLAGVSKVGSYTGTGSNVDVDCGFSAGARFILIKRSDSTGDWYVYDSVRGIVAGNDPYLLLNTTAAEVTSTDYIDPLSSGFTVTSSAPAALNASGGTYIFLAIAQVT